MAPVHRLKQTGVQCGTEYIDKRRLGLVGLSVDDAVHKYQFMKQGSSLRLEHSEKDTKMSYCKSR